MGIRDYLRQRQVHFALLLHRPAASAARMAETLHRPGRSIAKSVLIQAGRSYVLAVVPATHRVDLVKLAKLLGAEEVLIATESDVMRIFDDCERGAIPPFGKLYGLTTIVDSTLAGNSEIIFVGNTRHEGFQMRFRDFEAIEVPMRGKFAAMISPRRRAQQRKAG